MLIEYNFCSSTHAKPSSSYEHVQHPPYYHAYDDQPEEFTNVVQMQVRREPTWLSDRVTSYVNDDTSRFVTCRVFFTYISRLDLLSLWIPTVFIPQVWTFIICYLHTSLSRCVNIISAGDYIWLSKRWSFSSVMAKWFSIAGQSTSRCIQYGVSWSNGADIAAREREKWQERQKEAKK